MASQAQKALTELPHDPYAILDQLDESAFLAELAGQVVEEFVYEIEAWNPRTRQKEKQYQLSKPGVDAVCTELAEHRNVVIRETGLDVNDDAIKREARFHVTATRYKIRQNQDGTITEIPLDSVVGVKRQPYDFVKKGGEKGGENPHWYETGAMKAARNARRRLIPEAIVVEFIKLWKGEKGRVRRVSEDDDRAPETTTEDTPSKSEMDRRKEEIALLLEDRFGKGAAWDDPKKMEVLEATFNTKNWKEISALAPADFMKRAESFETELAKVPPF